MLRLGFNKFYAQGGDWGSAVVSHLSSLFPNKYVLLMMTCLIIQRDLTYEHENNNHSFSVFLALI